MFAEASKPTRLHHQSNMRPFKASLIWRTTDFFIKQKKNRPGVFQANRSLGYYIAFYLCFSPSRSVFLYFFISYSLSYFVSWVKKRRKNMSEWDWYYLWITEKDISHVILDMSLIFCFMNYRNNQHENMKTDD